MRLRDSVLGSAFLSGLLSGGAVALGMDDNCLDPVIVQPVEIVGQHPFIIDTFIAANTVVIINEDISITITDAPKQLSSTMTSTVTVTSSIIR